ncbi:hypothetical protein HMPREF0762_01090 [Slackia exigua ATCC 700122]|uniref:Uncharacterized protein n=1 Tax=Slackia exigua (strain ATCC 700122 / DSM 15923 / CIP 105133 / JCM 11022 / KCTC 5966 / S-7) TaxID=649764 RepID=D0WGY5_SLAES|nr:hypothetical protein HMPREF0762_01090 [Slackia exigua ATCC 700122]
MTDSAVYLQMPIDGLCTIAGKGRCSRRFPGSLAGRDEAFRMTVRR